MASEKACLSLVLLVEKGGGTAFLLEACAWSLFFSATMCVDIILYKSQKIFIFFYNPRTKG